MAVGGTLLGLGLDAATGGTAGLVGEGIGLAAGIAGSIMGSQAAKGEYQAQSNLANLEQQASNLSYQQSELTGRRSQLQVLRNSQQARSQALANSVGQGAQFGSGVQGGYGQIAGVSGNNLLGINQNLSFGAQQNAISQQETTQKLALGSYESKAATAAGISSLGGGIGSAGKSLVGIASNPSGSLFF